MTTLVLAAQREGLAFVEVPDHLVRLPRHPRIPKHEGQPHACGESWPVSGRHVELWCLLGQGHMVQGEPHGWSVCTWTKAMTPGEAEEVAALRDADRLHLLPVEALIASIRHLATMLVGPKT